MHIVCPNCTTSYAVDPAQLGPNGRTVRCSRCKDTWLARAEDVVNLEMAEQMARDGTGHGREREAGSEDGPDSNTPVIDSPSISTAVDAGDRGRIDVHAGWPAEHDEAVPRPASKLGRVLGRGLGMLRLPASLPAIPVPQFARHYLTLPIACIAMAALSVGLVVWRTDVVRLMPQTAAFFKMAGFEVNLRGLRIENVKVSTETIDGKPGFIIEGAVAGIASKPLQVPRLRFIVRDDKGTEIYAWTSVLEQSVLNPGERAAFRTRLAAPPAEAREIAVRFFNRRDIGA